MKYEIEMNDNQLNLIIQGIEIFARSLMGQASIVSDFLADAVYEEQVCKFVYGTPEWREAWEKWLNNRDNCRCYMQLGLDSLLGEHAQRGITADNLIDIWHVFRHQQWLNAEEKYSWDVRSQEPFPFGTEPLIKLTAIKED